MRRFRHTLLAWLSVAALLGAVSAPASVAADAFSTWTPGPGAAGDNTYAGFIDMPPANIMVPTGNFQVAGWFVDTTAQGWAGADDVQVFLGTMDGGGKMLAKAFFAQSRPDVAAALANPFWVASGFQRHDSRIGAAERRADTVRLCPYTSQGLVVQAGPGQRLIDRRVHRPRTGGRARANRPGRCAADRRHRKTQGRRSR